MKKGLFLFFIMINVQVFGQNPDDRSKKLAEELGKKFSLSKLQIDNIYQLNLKTVVVLDSLIMKSNQEKAGRIPLEKMSIEEEKELERIEKQWRKAVKKIIGLAKIRTLKKEERRERKKSSPIKGLEYNETFEITSKEFGFLNLRCPY
jgi:hypothetical protein